VTGRTSIDTQSRPYFVASSRVRRPNNDIPLNTPGFAIHYKALFSDPRAALCFHFLSPSMLRVNHDMRNVDIFNARVLEKIMGPRDIRVIHTINLRFRMLCSWDTRGNSALLTSLKRVMVTDCYK
jgi:hypothetical protein